MESRFVGSGGSITLNDVGRPALRTNSLGPIGTATPRNTDEKDVT
jgi:hypothetical protein